MNKYPHMSLLRKKGILEADSSSYLLSYKWSNEMRMRIEWNWEISLKSNIFGKLLKRRRESIELVLKEIQAGSGKTTLCIYIARMMQEKWKEYDVDGIVMVKLRDLVDLKDFSIRGLLEKIGIEKRMRKVIENRVEKIVWIWDGYDEVESICMNNSEKQELLNFLQQIVKGIDIINNNNNNNINNILRTNEEWRSRWCIVSSRHEKETFFQEHFFIETQNMETH